MDKLKLAVIFGGASTEHEVSLVSATNVLLNLDTDKYDVLTIGITKEGEWLLYNGDYSKIKDGSWMKRNCREAFISPDCVNRGLVIWGVDGKIERLPIDIIFPVLHGKNGEDGTIQGLFELAKIPYVGCNNLSSAICMDKSLTHTVLDFNNIKTAPWQLVYDYELNYIDIVEKRIADELGYPVFVKPANSGSSVGISKASGKEELEVALKHASVYDRKIVIEKAIIGAEVECAVLGNDQPVASITGEIVPENDFYDYNAKYIDDNTALFIPARISKENTEKVKIIAIEAYKVLNCSGLSRVDFFVNNDTDEIILNEINTLPGFTSISMYPKLFEAEGIGYSELLDRLISLAIERGVGR